MSPKPLVTLVLYLSPKELLAPSCPIPSPTPLFTLVLLLSPKELLIHFYPITSPKSQSPLSSICHQKSYQVISTSLSHYFTSVTSHLCITAESPEHLLTPLAQHSRRFIRLSAVSISAFSAKRLFSYRGGCTQQSAIDLIPPFLFWGYI